MQVIYGDTDSIMIHTGTSDVAAARQLGANIKREVNRRYRLLEIELDAVYKTMLLLKKKKYAGESSQLGLVQVVRCADGNADLATCKLVWQMMHGDICSH